MLSTNSRGLGEISTETLTASDFCPSLSGVLDNSETYPFCESEVIARQSLMITRQSLKTDLNSQLSPRETNDNLDETTLDVSGI